jgi:poly(3-hydroxyalkanoate) synthetase
VNRITVGLEALAKSMVKRIPQSAVIFYPDRSGHVVNRISKDEEQIVFSFQEPAELFAWLMADIETRAAMNRKAKARVQEQSSELEQALRDLAKPERIQ